MKKNIALLLTACALLSTACFTSCSESSTAPLTTPTATEKVIDFTDDNGMGFTKIEDGTLEVSQIGNGTEVEIPRKYNGIKVTSVGRNAFRMSDVTKVTLPDTITVIEDYAFAFATSLESVNIPDGVTDIGMNAFSGCISLRKITLPQSLERIDIYAFDGTALKKVTLPKNLDAIGEYAFAECPYLTEVTFECNKVIISENAFNNSNNVIIYGKKGSSAISFAENEGIDNEII